MAQNFLRLSQLVGGFGPGSYVDFPERSVIIAGLSQWDRQAGIEISEPRLIEKLSRALGIPDLRLFTPPPYDDAPNTQLAGVTARIFPTWFVGQDRIPNSGSFGRRRLVGINATEKNGLFYRDPDDGKRKEITPTRFICACRRGHTDDVDWRTFVHRGKTDCQRTLWIEERGTSGEVADTWVGCDCGEQRRLYDALDLNTFALGRCNGKRPWLGQFASESDCVEPNRLLVRSASNAYFAETMSVISLPEEGGSSELDEIWDLIRDVQSIADLEMLRRLQKPVRAALQDLSNEQAFELIERRRVGEAEERAVKELEFDTLATGREIIGHDEFDSRFYAQTVERSKWDPESSPILDGIDNLVLVHRLREVIAQVGFTRFEPPTREIDGELDMDVQRQSLDIEVKWLPAIEHRGEGVFLQFKASAIEAWLSRPAVAEHIAELARGFNCWRAEHRSERLFPGGPYVMLHSLSHLLLSSIALDCGYPASSLRERVYAFRGRYGIMIHTGSSDAEGTLGGLVEAGKNIRHHLVQALKTGKLCSNDPVCSDHAADNQDEKRYLHGAACHGCLLIAETSCEQSNDLLDRALVVPTVTRPDAAFFNNGV